MAYRPKQVRRPRVLASHEEGGFVFNTDDVGLYTTPAVKVKVEFDLHDHTRALEVLDEAVALVKAQIIETQPSDPLRVRGDLEGHQAKFEDSDG